MSFSDMMSSGRGPGVIGMVLALIVLLGFGLLFMFAFDEGFQGADQSIESIIRDQAKDIGNMTEGIARGERDLALAPARVTAARDLARLKREKATLEQSVVTLREKIAEGERSIEDLTATFESYKDQYRAYARANAKGDTIEELKTVDGTLYKDVSIREVTAIGIQIRHSDGHKRIAFEELPHSMRDHFQFDPDQKQKAVAAEAAIRSEHEAAAAVANKAEEAKMAAYREKEIQLMKEKNLQLIQEKTAQISMLENDIKGLERDQERAAAAADAARAAGRMHINKSGTISGDIRSKRNRISVLNAEILRLRASL